jgi:hypothetical protein
MSAFHRFARLAGTIVAGTALGVAALASAGTASASKVDDDFVALVQRQGLPIKSGPAVVRAAGVVCQSFADGESMSSIAKDIVSATALETRQAALFIVDSVFTYCPQYTSRLSM